MLQLLFAKKDSRKLQIVFIFMIQLFLSNHSFSLQLGDGTMKDRWSPVKIMDNVKQVSGGLEHTLIVVDDNSLWSVGCNSSGQLGDGTTKDTNIPKKIMNNVVAVSAGNNFSLALKDDGSLWIFGSVPTVIEKAQDKFSVDTIKYQVTTKPILIDNDVIAISAGSRYSLYIKKDHSLWGFGDNDNGNLGDGTKYPKVIPIKIREHVQSVYAGQISSLIIDDSKSLCIAGNIYPGTVKGKTGFLLSYEEIAKNVISMTEGLYITSNNTLWGYGFAAFGNLGLGVTQDIISPTFIMSEIQTVASSQSHTLILKQTGELLSCGGGPNMFGGLGDGTNKPHDKPVSIMTDVKAIAVGYYHSLVIKNDNSLWSFGLNSYAGLQ